MIPPKRFDIFPPDCGVLRRGLDAFGFFFKYIQQVQYILRVSSQRVYPSIFMLPRTLEHSARDQTIGWPRKTTVPSR